MRYWFNISHVFFLKRFALWDLHIRTQHSRTVVWIKPQVCSVRLFTCSACRQAFPGEDGAGAIPDGDQRPAGPAVRDARRARLGQEVSQRWGERRHHGGKTSSSGKKKISVVNHLTSSNSSSITVTANKHIYLVTIKVSHWNYSFTNKNLFDSVEKFFSCSVQIQYVLYFTFGVDCTKRKNNVIQIFVLVVQCDVAFTTVSRVMATLRNSTWVCVEVGQRSLTLLHRTWCSWSWSCRKFSWPGRSRRRCWGGASESWRLWREPWRRRWPLTIRRWTRWGSSTRRKSAGCRRPWRRPSRYSTPPPPLSASIHPPPAPLLLYPPPVQKHRSLLQRAVEISVASGGAACCSAGWAICSPSDAVLLLLSQSSQFYWSSRGDQQWP